MVVLRADPWTPEYGMGLEYGDDEPAGRSDPSVETSRWDEPVPATAPEAGPVWFVDGVRRVDLRLIGRDDEGRRGQGLFGTFAAGSVCSDGRARFGEHRVGRAVVLSGGMLPPAVEVGAERGPLRFEAATTPGTDVDAPVARLQELMRDAEAALAAAVGSAGAGLVLSDGPLRLGDPVPWPVVGVIKRLVRRYLDDPQEDLLGRLRPGTRTPVFALLDQQDAVRGYSWYTRLVALRPPWHDHAGVVRCEVRASLGLDRAVALADSVSGLLPGFAGRPSDPRAPQNLAPVGALEAWLRHRMGHGGMIRRTLVEWLTTHEEAES